MQKGKFGHYSSHRTLSILKKIGTERRGGGGEGLNGMQIYRIAPTFGPTYRCTCIFVQIYPLVILYSLLMFGQVACKRYNTSQTELLSCRVIKTSKASLS